MLSRARPARLAGGVAAGPAAGAAVTAQRPALWLESALKPLLRVLMPGAYLPPPAAAAAASVTAATAVRWPVLRLEKPAILGPPKTVQEALCGSRHPLQRNASAHSAAVPFAVAPDAPHQQTASAGANYRL